MYSGKTLFPCLESEFKFYILLNHTTCTRFPSGFCVLV